jgi:iron complex outermembrane receptor protein
MRMPMSRQGWGDAVNDPAMNKKLAYRLGATSIVALTIAMTASAVAQTKLDAIEVQVPTQKPAAKKPSSPSRVSAGRSASNRNRNVARQATVTPAPAAASSGGKESATGHVDGYVATRSGTGTKTDAPLIETPAAVTVITQDQIQAQGTQSLAQAVRYSSGVRSEGNGADARGDTVFVRGFQADQYLDSLKLLYFNGFGQTIIEPFNLERAEVLHGPASILFGQASPGGVVDMVSKRPTEVPYHEMFVSTGSYNRVQAGVDLSGPIDKDKKFLYRVTASGFDVGSQVDNTGYQRISIAPSLTWRPDNDTTLTVLGTYQRDPKAGFYNQLTTRGAGMITPLADGRQIPTSFYAGEPGFDKTERSYGSLGYFFERKFGNSFTLRQNVRYNDLDTDLRVVTPVGSQTDPANLRRTASTNRDTTTSFQIDNQTETKFDTGPFQHTVLAGVDYLYGTDHTYIGAQVAINNIDAFNPLYGQRAISVPTTTENRQALYQVGFYTQDQIKFDRFVALLGTREDIAGSQTDSLAIASGRVTSSSKYDVANTKRAALLYKFDNGVAPYVQYTESFQPSAGADFFGNSFRPTTGQQEEVGVKYQPNQKSLYSVAWYDLVQQNVLTPDPVAAHGATARVQTGEIRSRGLEFEAKTEINDNLKLLAAYTYLDLTVTKTNTVAQLGKKPTGFPANSASLWADYTFHGGALDGFGVSGGVRYYGESAGTTDNTFWVPAVTLVDAAAHYDFAALGPQFKGYQVQVNATNLFDKTYVTQCQDIGCYYGLRRQVIATLRYKW